MNKIEKLELALKEITEVMNELEVNCVNYDTLRLSKNGLISTINELDDEE